MSVRCTKCGDVRNTRFSRACAAGGECEYEGTERPRSVSPWLTCTHRSQTPIATVAGTVAGCGCPGSTVEVFRCDRFAEPVIKHGRPPCLDTFREKVPGFTGRTCRRCPVPLGGYTDIFHVTPRADWQHVTTRGEFALRTNGQPRRCVEIVKPSPDKLERDIEIRRPSVVFVHAFAVPAASVIALAERWPAVRFVVISHSMENHAFTWPQYFGEMRLILQASKRLANMRFAGSEDCSHWRELGYDVLRWHWPCLIGNHYADPPPIDPSAVLIVSRTDIVKAIPAQLLAAAILQRRRGVRVILSLADATGPRGKGLDDLIAAAGLTCERWGWTGYDDFLQRLRDQVTLVLQPSMSETFNYVTWEAGSVGRPWVGSAAIRHTPDDWKADPNDARDIARIAERILDDYPDNSRWARQIAEKVATCNNQAYTRSIAEIFERRNGSIPPVAADIADDLR